MDPPRLAEHRAERQREAGHENPGSGLILKDGRRKKGGRKDGMVTEYQAGY